MPIPSRRGPVAILLVMAALAACAPGPSGGDGAAATAAATPVAPTAAAATASIAGPLEDLVPDEVAGIPLVKAVVHGPDIVDLDPEDAAGFAAILERVDGPPEAFTSVTALGPGIAIAAMRMEGTDGRQLGEAMIFVVMDTADGNATVEDITIAGKEVKRVTPRDTTAIHVYVTGEIMFVVQAADPTLVEEAFALLP